MRGILYMSHSGARYLVLLAAIVAIVYLVTSLSKKGDTRARMIMGIFTGLLDLQVLLGLLVLTQVPFYGQLAGHIVMMFAAAGTAHGFSIVNKNRPPEAQSNGLLLMGVLVTMALVIGGIMAIGRPIFGSVA